jgi:hypothetical protein
MMTTMQAVHFADVSTVYELNTSCVVCLGSRSVCGDAIFDKFRERGYMDVMPHAYA